MKKRYSQNFPKIHKKTPVFFKKESLAQMFSCEFYEISKNTPFLQNISGQLLLHLHL